MGIFASAGGLCNLATWAQSFIEQQVTADFWMMGLSEGTSSPVTGAFGADLCGGCQDFGCAA